MLSKTFTLGHDVLAQHDSTDGTLTFLYDGHGSTRALVDAAATIAQAFAYNAYGQPPHQRQPHRRQRRLHEPALQRRVDRRPRCPIPPRRWYNPSTGRFNRLDPFAGNASDPQSLHKYLYVHANPVMNVDPLGEMSAVEQVAVVTVSAFVTTFITSYAVTRDAGFSLGLATTAGDFSRHGRTLDDRILWNVNFDVAVVDDFSKLDVQVWRCCCEQRSSPS